MVCHKRNEVKDENYYLPEDNKYFRLIKALSDEEGVIAFIKFDELRFVRAPKTLVRH